jgi:large subunit ribosomal protein L6
MSRIGKAPVTIPQGIEVTLDTGTVQVKGPKGTLQQVLHHAVEVVREGDQLEVRARAGHGKLGKAMSGTTRSLLDNMVAGVTEGFQKKLELVGVGYRAQAQGSVLNLTLGFSHPVAHAVPDGIVVETPTQTEILVKGIDKQQVGQVAAEIRAYRPPEPYKGKGVRYSDEHVVRKEAKKK